MTTPTLAAALERVHSIFKRRPEAGLHDDAPAAARWEGGTRVVARHADGTQLPTDMPTEFGGSGDQVTPGWLFRAGFASCAATSIVMAAAAEGIELAALEVRASSRSDARGLLGMAGADGEPVFAGPGDMQLQVTVAAPGVAAERLRAVVESGVARSPIPNAVQQATPFALLIEITAA
ncbi:MAG: OsmC family protein [Burkholderiales bacterium]|nr:OsmC family protein [Burkholderiales bacterium]